VTSACKPVKASPHITRRRAQIYAHTRRQVNHWRSRNTVSTVRKVEASTPAPICKRSPPLSHNFNPMLFCWLASWG
jgi:hypothetical protein